MGLISQGLSSESPSPRSEAFQSYRTWSVLVWIRSCRLLGECQPRLMDSTSPTRLPLAHNELIHPFTGFIFNPQGCPLTHFTSTASYRRLLWNEMKYDYPYCILSSCVAFKRSGLVFPSYLNLHYKGTRSGVYALWWLLFDHGAVSMRTFSPYNMVKARSQNQTRLLQNDTGI